MPKCASCGSELEYAYWLNNDFIIDILQCPNCKLIYGLEMKF